MPVFPNKVPDLKTGGAIIEIVVFPPQPVIATIEANKVVSKKVIALIDTGASMSSIDNIVAKELNLIARDVVQVYTPSGKSEQPLYDLSITLTISAKNNLIPIQAFGCDLTNQPYDALIGRDILAMCTFIYNGWDNSYQLHF